MKHRLERNIQLALFFSGFRMFFFIFSVLVPIFQSHRLTFFEIFVLQSFFSIFVAIIEVPSGYLSDHWGRKKTLIISSFFWILAILAFNLATSFFDFMIFEFLCAISLAFFSGTDLSLLYDSQLALGKLPDQKNLAATRMFFVRLFEGMGSLMGGLLAMIDLTWPAIFQLIFSIIPLILAFFLFEPPREKLEKKKHFESIQFIWNCLFKKSSFLTLMILNMMIWGGATLLGVWCFQPYLKALHFSYFYYGLFWCFFNLITAITAPLAYRLKQRFGLSKILILIILLPLLSFLGMSSVNAGWGIMFVFLVSISRGLQTIFDHLINLEIPSSMRATANSITSLGVRLIFCLIGPITGYLMDHQSMGQSLLFITIVFFILAIIFVIPLLLNIKFKAASRIVFNRSI